MWTPPLVVMKLLLLISLLSSSVRCSDVSEREKSVMPPEFTSLLTKRGRDSFIDESSLTRTSSSPDLIHQMSLQQAVYTNSPAFSTATTASAVTEDSPLPTKKRKYKRVEEKRIEHGTDDEEQRSKTDFSVFISETSASGRVTFDLEAAEKEFEKLPTRMSKLAFVHGLLMIKYRDVFPKQSKRIIWSRVDVIGWPSLLKSWTVNDLTVDEAWLLLQNLNTIRFVRKEDPESGKKHSKENREANDALHETLLKDLKDLNVISKRGYIKWKKLVELVPLLTLTSRDHRVWSGDDRINIQSLILEDLIPRLKREKDETDEWLLSMLHQIE